METELETSIICPSCHSKLQGNPKFCMKCGAKIDYKAVKQNYRQSRPLNELKQSLKPSLGLTSTLHTHAISQGSGSALETNGKMADYWEPQKMKALIFSIASAIGILLTALGLWYVSSLEPALSTDNAGSRELTYQSPRAVRSIPIADAIEKIKAFIFCGSQ